MAILLSGFTPENSPVTTSLAVLWSFLWGMRGIIWHQLYDFEHDIKSSVKTMPGVTGYERTIFISEKILFPAETVFFTILLTIMQPVLLIPFFVCIVMELAGNYNSVVPRK
jgi:4-hydroxybenzoate polyprenyltransferase